MKKYAILMAVVLCCGLAVVASQNQFSLSNAAPAQGEKGPAEPRTAADGDFKNEVRQGGDTCGDAVAIASLPFAGSGTTLGYTNDYDEVCPYTGSTSPDVVYMYTPGANETVIATLCGPTSDTDYDTKLYVYENTCPTPGTPFACNDDACSTPLASFVSQLTIDLTGGNTYYFVIDGYGGAAGDYTFDLLEAPTCGCVGDELPEGDPDCGFTGLETNGGCNQSDIYDPTTFTSVSCNTSICGTVGTYIDPDTGGNFRDTDWFMLNLPQDDGVHVTVTSATDLVILELLNLPNCAAVAVGGVVNVGSCIPGTLDMAGVTGDNYFFVGPTVFDGIPCGAEYVVEVACDVVPVELQQFIVE